MFVLDVGNDLHKSSQTCAKCLIVFNDKNNDETFY